MINQLKTLARTVTPMVLDIYDRENVGALLAYIARTVTNPAKVKQQTFEWWTAFPELRKWVGDRKTQRVFKDSLTLDYSPFEMTYDVDRMDLELDGGNSIVDVAGMARYFAKGFVDGKLKYAYKIFTDNPITYDGQNLFDTDHTHPDGTVFSNLLTRGTDTVARGTDAAPTVAEVRAELKIVLAALLENTLVRNTLVDTAEAMNSLVVIARDFNTWSAFHDLLTEERIGGDPNRFRGTFQLLRDFDTTLGTKYDVIHAVPGGPRPVIFGISKEPGAIEYDESQVFKNRYVPFGMDGIYAAAAAFPQPVVRVSA